MKEFFTLNIFLFFLLFFSIGTKGQSYEKLYKLKPCKDSTDQVYQKWYVSGLMGYNLFFGDLASSSNVTGGGVDGKFSWMFQANIGREINQNFGIRVNSSFGKLYSQKNNNWFEADIHDISVDFLINMSNIIFPYNFDKSWNTNIYAGLGFFGYKSTLYDNNNSIINVIESTNGGHKYSSEINIGIIESYRLTDNIDLSLELSASKLVIDDLDGKIGGTANDLRAKLALGIIYNIGKSRKSYKYNSEPCRWTKANTEIVSLEERIDSLERTYVTINPCDTSTVDSDNDAIPDCRDIEPNSPEGAVVNFQGKAINQDTITQTNEVIIKDIQVYFSPVFFQNNEYKVEKSEEGTVYKLAVYIKQNPNVKVLITGHAGKKGSEEYNMKLSQQRCDAVKTILVNDYGINKNQIETKADGKSNILFEKKANGNRRVDFTIIK